MARLTPLGSWVIREQFTGAGVEVPLLSLSAEMTAADLVAAAEGLDEDELAAETDAWLGVSRRSWCWVAEPDSDRGDVDGSAPNEVAFVVPGHDGAVLAELAEGALDGVAVLAGGGVEGGWAAALAAAPDPVAGLVGGLGMVALMPRRRRWARIAALE